MNVAALAEAAITDSDEALSVEEAALHLGCAASTLARWRVQGRGPKHRRTFLGRIEYRRCRRGCDWDLASTGLRAPARLLVPP
jgi:hypothetical protein